jgi:hypothetical protein
MRSECEGNPFTNWQIASGSHTPFTTVPDVRHMTGVKLVLGISLSPILAYRGPAILGPITHDACYAPHHGIKMLPHKPELVGKTHALFHTMP